VSEERAYPRYEVDAYVDVTGTEVLLYHQIQNISLGGICIQTPTLESRGTMVDVVINFPDLGKVVRLHGEVVWANHEPPQDMGIRWVGMTEEQKALLREFLAEANARLTVRHS
jgi:uncharacterized protein (TIGR02266 family)